VGATTVADILTTRTEFARARTNSARVVDTGVHVEEKNWRLSDAETREWRS